MSVLVIVDFTVPDLTDATDVMQMNSGTLDDLTRDARRQGAIHHQFYTTDDNHMIALDEWESPEAFQAFFGSNQQIQDLTKQAGIEEPPKITILNKLEVAGTF